MDCYSDLPLEKGGITAKQCHTACAMINLNWHGDIGFPPHSRINRFFLSLVKSKISLTHLERLGHLFVSYYTRGRRPNTSFSWDDVLFVLCFKKLFILLAYRIEMTRIYAFQSTTDKSRCLINPAVIHQLHFMLPFRALLFFKQHVG